MATYSLFPIPHHHEDARSLPIILEPHDVDRQTTLNDQKFREEIDRTPRVYENDDTMKEVTLQIPTHPIPSMQGAFAESMLESSEDLSPIEPRNIPGTAAARRKQLIDQSVDEETHAARWKQKPGQQYHELWKLMAQISFGIYLLLNGIAKDDEQVMTILQGHVDEVDEFLETTLEDFDLAQEDVDERLKFLKLPLENIIIFDAMLEDPNFRLQIVDGNERIEHVITRTAKLMNDVLKDVRHGIDACKEFTIYLAEEQDKAVWRDERPDMDKVFVAMKGNVEGWYKAYVSLQTKGHHLGVALVQLGSIVAEMDKRAAVISKKSRFSTSPTSTSSSMASPPHSSPQSRQMRQSMLKNLPSDPNFITPAIRATLPAFQLMEDRERTPEPEPRQSASSDEAETDFILKPRTYTPVPSPRPQQNIPDRQPTPVQEPASAPEPTKRSSIRKRFSLGKKKDSPELAKPPTTESENGYWGPKQRIVSISGANRERDKDEMAIREHLAERESTAIRESMRYRDSSFNRDSTLNTPPSRGLDSAYCSDFDSKPSPPGTHPALTPTISQPSSSHGTSPTIRTAVLAPGPMFSRDQVPTPRSDQQHFRPVHANPNSPLQRPWTAGPANPLHVHNNSSTSNLSSLRGHTHTPSALGNRRGAPSAMGMSMMSDMTTVETKNGKVKKKRSAFGWLKKAFSLSEEEKAAFEERRRRAEEEERRNAYSQRLMQKNLVDGKWVDRRRGK